MYLGDPTPLAAQDGGRSEMRRLSSAGCRRQAGQKAKKHKLRPDLVDLTGVRLSEAELSHISYAVSLSAKDLLPKH